MSKPKSFSCSSERPSSSGTVGDQLQGGHLTGGADPLRADEVEAGHRHRAAGGQLLALEQRHLGERPLGAEVGDARHDTSLAGAPPVAALAAI